MLPGASSERQKLLRERHAELRLKPLANIWFDNRLELVGISHFRCLGEGGIVFANLATRKLKKANRTEVARKEAVGANARSGNRAVALSSILALTSIP